MGNVRNNGVTGIGPEIDARCKGERDTVEREQDTVEGEQLGQWTIWFRTWGV